MTPERILVIAILIVVLIILLSVIGVIHLPVNS